MNLDRLEGMLKNLDDGDDDDGDDDDWEWYATAMGSWWWCWLLCCWHSSWWRRSSLMIMVHLVGRLPHECHDFRMMHRVIKEIYIYITWRVHIQLEYCMVWINPVPWNRWVRSYVRTPILDISYWVNDWVIPLPPWWYGTYVFWPKETHAFPSSVSSRDFPLRWMYGMFFQKNI